jgi:CRP-like cAMP-binding protein
MKMDVKRLNTLSYLQTLPIFKDLSKSECENAAQDCQFGHLSRGEVLFQVGDACEVFHVITSGQVKLYLATPTGQEKVIEIVGPDQSFAESTMLLGTPYLFNAQALTETELLTVGKRTILALMERNHRFSMHLTSGISHWLHQLISDVGGYALQSGMHRLINYLLQSAQGKDTKNMESFTVFLPVSKATIASRLSLTPEYFSRVLHELASERLIEINRRQIRVLDVHRLANYRSN